ncbi:unnamed protein product, partial [Heterotrigona itama]
PQMIKQDPTVMSWGLWISTLTTTSAALVTAGLAALLAVLNTATSPSVNVHGEYEHLASSVLHEAILQRASEGGHRQYVDQRRFRGAWLFIL